MTDAGAIEHLALATAALAWIIGAYQIGRKRDHTRAEKAFAAAHFLLGAYALADWVFLVVGDAAVALVALRLEVTFAILSAFAFLLFARWFLGEHRRGDVLAAVPAALALVVLWTTAVRALRSTAIGFDPVWGVPESLTLLAYFGAYALGIGYFLLRASLVVEAHNAALARRVRTLMLALVSGVVLGLLLTLQATLSGLGKSHLVSAALVVPLFLEFLVYGPVAPERLAAVLRSRLERTTGVVGAMLVYVDGTILAKEAGSDLLQADEDVFAGTLDALQSFMESSFAFLRGQSLRRIEQGDFTVLLERGKWTYLVVFLRGRENEFLRLEMREALAAFEGRNADRLPGYRGLVDELRGVGDTLRLFTTERGVF